MVSRWHVMNATHAAVIDKQPTSIISGNPLNNSLYT